MSINIRQKGQTGEREVAQALNPIVLRLLAKHGHQLPPADKPPIQRNQNQSAVGGSDLTGTFGLAIEIKRQEQLSINTWWEQCLASAKNSQEVPVLVYRQNGKKWRVVLYAAIGLPDGRDDSTASRTSGGYVRARVEMDWESFLRWFEVWVDKMLQGGLVPYQFG